MAGLFSFAKRSALTAHLECGKRILFVVHDAYFGVVLSFPGSALSHCFFFKENSQTSRVNFPN